MFAATERPSPARDAREALAAANQAVRDAYARRTTIAERLVAAEASLVAADRRAVDAVASVDAGDDAEAMSAAADARVRCDATRSALARADQAIEAAETGVKQAARAVQLADAGEAFAVVRATLPALEAALEAFAESYKTIDSAYRAGMLLRGSLAGSGGTPQLYLSWQTRKRLMKLGVDLHMLHSITPSEPFDLARAIEERLVA